MEMVSLSNAKQSNRNPKKVFNKTIKYIVIVLISLAMVTPFVWMLSASLKLES